MNMMMPIISRTKVNVEFAGFAPNLNYKLDLNETSIYVCGLFTQISIHHTFTIVLSGHLCAFDMWSLQTTIRNPSWHRIIMIMIIASSIDDEMACFITQA